jgi:hypothetical protein
MRTESRNDKARFAVGLCLNTGLAHTKSLHEVCLPCKSKRSPFLKSVRKKRNA